MHAPCRANALQCAVAVRIARCQACSEYFAARNILTSHVNTFLGLVRCLCAEDLQMHCTAHIIALAQVERSRARELQTDLHVRERTCALV